MFRTVTQFTSKFPQTNHHALKFTYPKCCLSIKFDATQTPPSFFSVNGFEFHERVQNYSFFIKQEDRRT